MKAVNILSFINKSFDTWWKNTIFNTQVKMHFPEEGLVYDYQLDCGSLFANTLDQDEPDEKDEFTVSWQNFIVAILLSPQWQLCW